MRKFHERCTKVFCVKLWVIRVERSQKVHQRLETKPKLTFQLIQNIQLTLASGSAVVH